MQDGSRGFSNPAVTLLGMVRTAALWLALAWTASPVRAAEEFSAVEDTSTKIRLALPLDLLTKQEQSKLGWT
jgi:hypothetical protein